MPNQQITNDSNKWNEIDSQAAYNLSQAEFKGMTIQALQDIRNDINTINREKEIKSYINYLISGVIGMIAALVSKNIKF